MPWTFSHFDSSFHGLSPTFTAQSMDFLPLLQLIQLPRLSLANTMQIPPCYHFDNSFHGPFSNSDSSFHGPFSHFDSSFHGPFSHLYSSIHGLSPTLTAHSIDPPAPLTAHSQTWMRACAHPRAYARVHWIIQLTLLPLASTMQIPPCYHFDNSFN